MTLIKCRITKCLNGKQVLMNQTKQGFDKSKLQKLKQIAHLTLCGRSESTEKNTQSDRCKECLGKFGGLVK